MKLCLYFNQVRPDIVLLNLPAAKAKELHDELLEAWSSSIEKSVSSLQVVTVLDDVFTFMDGDLVGTDLQDE